MATHAPDDTQPPANEYPTENEQGHENPHEEPAHERPAPEEDSEAFCNAGNMMSMQVQMVGGTLNGYSIGFVAVYSFLFLTSTDCSLYTTAEACGTVANADCVLGVSAIDPTRQFCGWEGGTCSEVHTNVDACLGDSNCNWIYSDAACKNPTGYNAADNGIFAGAMIVGAMIGSIYAGQFAAAFGHNLSFLIVGVVGVVASVMYHVSAGTNEFWVLCVGRLIIGVVLALVNVACPMFTDQNASKKYLKMIGVMFQVFTTLGIALAAIMGVALGQSIVYDRNTQIVGRMEGLSAVSTLLSLIMIVLGIFLGESKTKFTTHTEDKKEGEVDLDPNEYSYMQMIGPLSMGVVTAGTLQLTGINAVMNYAPTIMSSLGMEPMVGNVVVMVWNFVTTLVAIPLARVMTMRQLFLICSLVASCACLFLCGIPVYPGVANTNVKNGVAIFGIAVFIAAFEVGVGPCFFVLAQDLFPRSFRPKGASFTILAQYVFNVIINVCYPIATERMSGGASGNQDKGQSIAFIFFGGIGLVCFVLQLFFLFPWEESEPTNTNPEDADDVTEQVNENSPVEVGTPGNRQAA